MDTKPRFIRHRLESLLDAYRMTKFNLFFPHGFTKFKHLAWMQKKTGAKLLIEAGSFHGVTAERAAKVFDRVITIELDPQNAKATRDRVAKYPNVEAIEGDVIQQLPAILSRPDVTEALVYLDGHYSGAGTSQTDNAEPACEAIDILAPFPNKIAGVVVDDFRCFGVNEGFPSKSELLRSVERHFPGFGFTVQWDQLVVWKKK